MVLVEVAGAVTVNMATVVQVPVAVALENVGAIAVIAVVVSKVEVCVTLLVAVSKRNITRPIDNDVVR